MKTLLCTAALLLFFIANFQGAEAQCGGFQESCEQFVLGSNGVFSAQCRTDAGALVAASINLDNCISNSNGNLVDGGGFSLSCGDYGWTNELVPEVAFFIIAQCRKLMGVLYSLRTRSPTMLLTVTEAFSGTSVQLIRCTPWDSPTLQHKGDGLNEISTYVAVILSKMNVFTENR